MKINEWKLEENLGVQIKEIRLINKDEKEKVSHSRIERNIFESKLPYKYQLLLYKLLKFYSLPFEEIKNNNWRIEVMGVYLKPENGHDTPHISLYADGEKAYYNGVTSISDMYSNIIFFKFKTKYVFPEPGSIRFEWFWKDDNKKIIKEYDADFLSSSIYLNKLPDDFVELKLHNIASQVFNDFREGKSIKKFLFNSDFESSIIKKFDWINQEDDIRTFHRSMYPTYIPSHQGYSNVLMVKQYYKRNTDINNNIGEQNFYFVEDNKGEWKIVDIGEMVK